jgi:hypothetical protein
MNSLKITIINNNNEFGRGFSNLEILQHNQIASLKNYFLNRARDNTFFNALVSADKGYTPLNLSDNSTKENFIFKFYTIFLNYTYSYDSQSVS